MMYPRGPATYLSPSAPPTAIQVYSGDDWSVPVKLTDAAGNPIDLTGSTIGATFWTTSTDAGTDLNVGNNGIVVTSLVLGEFTVDISSSMTANIADQSVLDVRFPTRIAIYVIGTTGLRQTLKIYGFQVLAPRTTDQICVPIAQQIVVLQPQGPAGPPGIGVATVLTFSITAASSFTASHGFTYSPRAWLVDQAGELVETDVLYAPGQVTVMFPGPFTGTLYLG